MTDLMLSTARLITARAELNAARARMHLLAGQGRLRSKAFRDAAEDVEFWGNKVAYLDAAITHELSK